MFSMEIKPKRVWGKGGGTTKQNKRQIHNIRNNSNNSSSNIIKTSFGEEEIKQFNFQYTHPSTFPSTVVVVDTIILQILFLIDIF